MSDSRRGVTSWRRIVDSELLWSFLALAAIVAVVSAGRGARTFDYEPGDILEADVVAPMALRVTDPDATRERREAAAVAVADVYDFDPLAWREPVRALNSLFAWGRESLEAAEGEAFESLDAERQSRLLAEGRVVAGFDVPDRLVVSLWGDGFSAETELASEGLLRNQLRMTLIGTLVTGFGGGEVVVRDIVEQRESAFTDLGSIIDLESARGRLPRQIEEAVDRPVVVRQALVELLGTLLRPNLTYNSAETQARRQAAAESVPIVLYEVKAGRTIGRAGDPVTPQMLRELDALQQAWSGEGSRAPVLGIALLSGLIILSTWRYVRYHKKRWRFHKLDRLYQLVLVMLVGSVLLTRVMLFVGEAVAGALPDPPYNVADAYRFAIPYAVGALVVLLLADAHAAWVFAGLQAILAGAITGSYEVAFFAALGSFAAIFGMTRYAERTEMLKTALTISVINALVVCGLALIADPTPPWSTVFFQIALAVFGAVQVALLASATLPALENVFGTLTDVKLLELSNMNLPLLRELAVAAPGTYHHSVVIGTLAEKAAQAIGANPLFARVAAYYHDIGKMRQPEYFVENQKDGRNPHDRLSPHMSALVLVRHVKDGVIMARDHRLPRPLEDVIPQHHGTRLMRYFYEKARQQSDPDVDTVGEAEFRYPGPKPQTKEAALVMLADGVEAMSRLIDEPTPQRLREMIRKNSRSILEDGQLDECDITLADLSRVEDAFLAVLGGMFHHRIEYPEATPGPEAPKAGT